MEIIFYFDHSVYDSRIEMNGINSYATKWRSKFLSQYISLHKTSNEIPVLEVSSKVIPFRNLITFNNGIPLNFKFCDAQGMQYEIVKGVDTFEIYTHPEGKYSVFKNKKQIAVIITYWEVMTTVLGVKISDKHAKYRNDKYVLSADDNCDAELLMAFCLMLRLTDSPQASFGVWEKKPFDVNWKFQPNTF